MKKLFFFLVVSFVVGISLLFYLTPAAQKITLLLQKSFPSTCNNSLVLVDVDDDYLRQSGSFLIGSEKSAELFDDVLLLSRELGAKSFVCDLNFKNPVVKIDSLVQKNEISKEKQISFFNIKIVIPWKERICEGTNTPVLSNYFFPIDFPLTSFSDDAFLAGNFDSVPGERQLVVKKDGEYFADPVFASAADFFGAKKIIVSESSFFLECPDRTVRIPRIKDGSLLLKYPAGDLSDCVRISFGDLFKISNCEKKFFRYISLMDEKGFFGEFEGENPIEIYSQAVAAKADFENYRLLKKKFYSTMSHYLSGRQERLLLEAVSDEEHTKLVQNMFATCRRLFSELETLRTKNSEKLSGSFCVFALTSSLCSDFVKSPFDSRFPKSLESYAAANMILSEDFFERLPLIFSGLTLALTIVFIFILILIFYLVKRSRAQRRISDAFLQYVPSSVVKKLVSKPSSFCIDGEKLEVSVLSVSLREGDSFRNILSESQLVAFLNYYFEKISSAVLKNGGLVESYRDDSVLALFGAPVPDEDNCALAVKSALCIKEKDTEINEDISVLPQSPKPDGMNDDLYTAFFILNHNGVKILTDVGIWNGESFCACMGGESKKSYRIAGESWKRAVEIKNLTQKFLCTGIVLNEDAGDSVKNEYIIRRLSLNSEKIAPIYEILGLISSDDEKLWNYANFWNQAITLLEKGESEKSLAIFNKLSEGRPSDKTARYFINYLNTVE